MARTKDYRRHKMFTKLENRLKTFYYNRSWYRVDGVNCFADYQTKVKNGEQDLWLRNTGVPCSCYTCSGYYKYNRLPQSEIKKIINEQLK